jgi:hypothetical protein
MATEHIPEAAMDETRIEAPKRGSHRLLLYVVVLAIVFLIGYVPMWSKLRDQTALREKAEQALTVTRIVKDLGSAAIDARRGAYEPARQEASTFFTAANFEIDQRDRSALTESQRKELSPLLGARDEIITLLARNDPASAERLSNLYVAVRKALGV